MSTNVEIVRSIYAAGLAGDLQGMLRHVDPEIRCYEAASLPYGGEYHGHEGFSRLMMAVFSSWASFTAEVKDMLDAGPTVIALIQLRVTLKESNRLVEMPIAEIWTLRDGKAIELRPFYWDTAQLLPNAPEKTAT